MITRIVLPLVALAMMIFAVASVVSSRPSDERLPPPEPPATTTFARTIAAVGLVEARTENIAVSTPVPGWVTKVSVKAGDRVKSGAKLFSLDDRDLQAQLAVRQTAVKVAEARVKVAEALLADARNQLALAESITDKRAISVDQLDKRRFAAQAAEARLVEARAEVASLRAQVKATETDIERLTVRAPVDGEILQVNIRPGEYAPTGVLPTPLMVLGDLDRLHVRVDVDENDAWRFRPGAPAVGHVRGNSQLRTPLRFERIEPYVIPKRALSGDTTERVDTRVMRAIYSFNNGHLPVYVGQQMDVFIEALPTEEAEATAAGPHPLPTREEARKP
jgi:RND family efflux transporter MFP subunit